MLCLAPNIEICIYAYTSNLLFHPSNYIFGKFTKYFKLTKYFCEKKDIYPICIETT